MTKQQRERQHRHQRKVQKKQRSKTVKSQQPYPHDAVFKRIFKNPEYCRALMQVLLMPSLYSIFNWPLVKIRESVATGAKGKERRADIVIEVPLLNSNFHIIITIILEHKSYRDNNTVLQMLGYYNEIAQESGSIILPIIVTCCKDKQAIIPSDYLSWSLQKQGAPEGLKKYFKKFPNFNCLLVNLHDLSYRRMRRGGEEVSLALFGMRNYWEMNDKVVGEIIKKTRLLAQQRRSFVLSVLIDYYDCADKGYNRAGFARVERLCFPKLKEEERLMPEMEFTYDKAAKADKAAKQAMRKGKQLGKQLGKLEMVKRFLQAGVDEQTICEAAQLSRQELAQIKCDLD